jgi:hypothetical protein
MRFWKGRISPALLLAHESISYAAALLIEVLAEEMDIGVYSLGSTTFKREDLERGFETDRCF